MAFLLCGDFSSLQILTRGFFPLVDELTHLSPASILCALYALKCTQKFSRWFYSQTELTGPGRNENKKKEHNKEDPKRRGFQADAETA